MTLSGQRLLVLIPTQDVFVKLHVRLAEGANKYVEPIFVFQNLFIEVVDVHVDTNRSDQSVRLAQDRDRRALEFSGANVELVI